ncbi:hypothetical protein [Xylanibacter brevis]|uniref:hypothetical protein n=1 Tax=Xylanibacter brevis TaxID=83231 RepID=UPI000484C5A6|nr:hypothetical protein [Xylanibacter brevis]
MNETRNQFHSTTCHQLRSSSTSEAADRADDEVDLFFRQASDVTHLSPCHPHNSEKMYVKRILDIIDKEISNKEKKRLYKNHRLIFVILSIDTKGNIILVELSSYGLMEKDISSKRMFNILNQIKKITINDIRPFHNNGYINFTVVRRFK